jgi:hypothetical protein
MKKFIFIPFAQKYGMQLLVVLGLLLFYLIYLSLIKPAVFSYQFSPILIERYLNSQDIYDYQGHERVIISDTDLYITAGYLYVLGADPTKYNFQHPPLIKYLFGWSILFFNNPFYVQIVLGMLLIIVMYVFSYRLTPNIWIATLSCVLLITDPLFIDVSSEGFLDMGVTLLAFVWIFLVIFFPKKFVLQGIVLGLLAISKFWTVALLFLIISYGMQLLVKDRLNKKGIFIQLAAAAIIFLLAYSKTFYDRGGFFNLPYFELKTLKFFMNHNVNAQSWSSVVLFLTGYFASWWDGREVLRYTVWSPLWPICLFLNLYLLKDYRRFGRQDIIKVIPVLYLLYLSTQVSFTRYYLVILPFLYIILAQQMSRWIGTVSKNMSKDYRKV